MINQEVERNIKGTNQQRAKSNQEQKRLQNSLRASKLGQMSTAHDEAIIEVEEKQSLHEAEPTHESIDITIHNSSNKLPTGGPVAGEGLVKDARAQLNVLAAQSKAGSRQSQQSRGKSSRAPVEQEELVCDSEDLPDDEEDEDYLDEQFDTVNVASGINNNPGEQCVQNDGGYELPVDEYEAIIEDSQAVDQATLGMLDDPMALSMKLKQQYEQVH